MRLRSSLLTFILSFFAISFNLNSGLFVQEAPMSLPTPIVFSPGFSLRFHALANLVIVSLVILGQFITFTPHVIISPPPSNQARLCMPPYATGIVQISSEPLVFTLCESVCPTTCVRTIARYSSGTSTGSGSAAALWFWPSVRPGNA
ncbi:hypothetical protein EXS71_00315 [Candidatus Uhrbacteria bacterium]|nr:hypothetical protein [Candidatus Uhrbacteria bacterium]